MKVTLIIATVAIAIGTPASAQSDSTSGYGAGYDAGYNDNFPASGAMPSLSTSYGQGFQQGQDDFHADAEDDDQRQAQYERDILKLQTAPPPTFPDPQD